MFIISTEISLSNSEIWWSPDFGLVLLGDAAIKLMVSFLLWHWVVTHACSRSVGPQSTNLDSCTTCCPGSDISVVLMSGVDRKSVSEWKQRISPVRRRCRSVVQGADAREISGPTVWLVRTREICTSFFPRELKKRKLELWAWDDIMQILYKTTRLYKSHGLII
jgi:hypothetical protein